MAEVALEPIYHRLHEQLCRHEVLHTDETTLQVLHEPGKKAQSKSYMWRTSGDAAHPIVLYEYQPDRKAKHPEAFLQGFKGYLHADGYDGYHKLPDGMMVAGCLAHLRRKFDEALEVLPEAARERIVLPCWASGIATGSLSTSAHLPTFPPKSGRKSG